MIHERMEVNAAYALPALLPKRQIDRPVFKLRANIVGSVFLLATFDNGASTILYGNNTIIAPGGRPWKQLILTPCTSTGAPIVAGNHAIGIIDIWYTVNSLEDLPDVGGNVNIDGAARYRELAPSSMAFKEIITTVAAKSVLVELFGSANMSGVYHYDYFFQNLGLNDVLVGLDAAFTEATALIVPGGGGILSIKSRQEAWIKHRAAIPDDVSPDSLRVSLGYSL